MLKRLYTILFLCFCLSAARAQFPAHPDSVYTFIKYNSVWSNTIKDWQPVDAGFKKQISQARTVRDTINCFVKVLEQLNDVHSYFIYRGEYFGHYKPQDSATYARLRPVLRRSQTEKEQFSTTMLPGRIAYVRVPAINAFAADEVNRFAQALHDSVVQYSSQKPKGFIVDLRLNSGGNMYPMLAGLGTLLGNTVIGYETDMNGNEVRKWEIQNGNFVTGSYTATAIRHTGKPVFEKLPVAVLTGPVTGSSGSMTTIAFKQRPHTVFIGEPTAEGYTTSNGYFTYGNTLIFLFATSFVADRNKNSYKYAVPVDILIREEDDFDNLLQDPKVKAALQWFKGK